MYESYFGLREPPFNVTPNPRLFFSHVSCREAFATLCYGVEQRKGIVVVTGEAGTGKTTLVKMFVHNATANVHSSCILDPHLNFTELLRCTLTVLGLSADGADRLTIAQRFYDYLVEQSAQDHLVVLLLDEAQDISDDVLNELTLLSDLEKSGAKLLQIIFVGQPEFEAKLERPSFQRLKQRVALRSRLTPLSDEEIQPYIDSRLSAAGYRGHTIFLDTAVERIVAYSKGIPRLINIICDNALLIACATSQNIVDAETIEEAADGLQMGERYTSLSSSHLTVTTEIEAEAVDAALPDIAVEIPARDHVDGLEDSIDDQILERPDDEIGSRAEKGNAKSDGPYHLGHADSDLRVEAMSTNQPVERLECALPDGELFAMGRSGPWIKVAHERRWAGLAAALVTLIVVFGVVELHSPQRQDVVTTLPVADRMATLKEFFAPIPGRIYRVLQAAPGQTESFDSAAFDMSPAFNSERIPDVDRLPTTERTSPPNRENERKPVEPAAKAKEAITPARAERAPSERSPGDTRAAASSSRFEVVDNSYVRNEPSDKAEVVATLRPGTRIQLVRRTGEYLQVRSLEQEAIRGYVHREDAFFRPF